MRIGFLLPTNYALTGPANGVRVQAIRQAEALTRLGHEVFRLDPWKFNDPRSFDVIQFFVGGFPNLWIEDYREHLVKKLVWAPMIDSNQSNKRYRLAAKLGGLSGSIYTIPGVLKKQAEGCDLVVVRSDHERQRIVEGLGIDASKVKVILNGVPAPVSTNPGEVRSRLMLPEEFVLHVSTYGHERKNVARMIEAIGPTGLPLVIAGTADPGRALNRVMTLASQFQNVRIIGYVEQRVLCSLYGACKVFCLPSHHEGTGLAALEAASYGASIVITRNGGPPSYFKELVEYVDPTSVDGIRAAVIRAWNAPASDALRNHVLSHLTWAASARALLNAYASISTP